MSRSARITERELVVYRAHGLLRVDDEPAQMVEARARRIRRLHRDLGLPYDVIAMLLPLVERIETLEGRDLTQR